ncbi:MAG: hypothetical protein GWN01_08580 [Nitrosopumilaceae archaeon]|nr:hypothetical protein [Nitrosopumilaceae archaeon]NIU00970.1 hypothetical protein [Nitrosopumilaceae archaeon]NIX61572.1 hypothetical protein [Nitrosopumilaceae archaeon]
MLSILSVIGIGSSFYVSEHVFDVFIQDQTTRPIELYLFRNEGTFDLATGVSIDDNTFTAEAGHSITAGDIVCFQDSIFIMQTTVLNVNVNEITIDSPFDYAFKQGAGCAYGTPNIAVDGSLTPQIFAVSPARLNKGVDWDITRMIVAITDDDPMDDGKFGGIPALTNGITVRVTDSFHYNLFNVKRNADFRLTAYDVSYLDATLGPDGLYSIGVRKSFGGQDKYGVVLRLKSETKDKFQLIVRDDLSALNEMYVKIQGHFVDY